MKITKKVLKTATLMYLYSDGHAVVCHKKHDKQAGEVSWTTLHGPEDVGVTTTFRTGRLIVNKEAIPFVLMANHVGADRASKESGSQVTREFGIEVGNVRLNMGTGDMILPYFPRALTTDIYYQPETSENWLDVKDNARWGSANVSKAA